MIWYGMLSYGMVCYGMLWYEVWVNVPSITEEFILFCIFKCDLHKSTSVTVLQFYTLNVCVLPDNSLQLLD